MPLAPGTRLGPYEVAEPIGKGGMGEVYRARDTKLERDVAIKVLPDELAADEERVARFEREAKLLASLNHPNIASIYGFESNSLVLELVEGPTLAERIEQGPIPIDEAIAIAKQIAEALEAGHEAGVIHRDLKPANVKVKDDGTVKVLDYGLAKALEGEAAGGVDSELSQSPTLTRQTQVGVILGTAAYMSPEQARGKSVDRRTDIFSFGVVLYEMLSGKKAFMGEDVPEVLASVINTDPQWSSLPSGLDSRLQLLLRRCLRKDRRQRLQAVGDIRIEIEDVRAEPTGGTAHGAVAARHDARTTLAWGLAVLAAAIAGGLTVWELTPDPSRPVARFVLSAAAMAPVVPSNGLDVAISPDGSRVAYHGGAGGGRELYSRRTEEIASVRLFSARSAFSNPFFSPDGNWVGFSTFDDQSWKKVSTRGGPAETLFRSRNAPRGASWAPDGTIIFGMNTPGTGLFRWRPGGEPEVLTAPDDEAGEIAHWWPEILPGGEAVLFSVIKEESTQIAVLDLTTGERRSLLLSGSNPRFASTGHIVYGLDGTLLAVPFDPIRLELIGEPVPVLEGVVTNDSGAVDFGLSEDGSLVYLAGEAGTPARHSLVWVDRNGQEESLAAEPRPYRSVNISPKGRQVALEIDDQESDIWIWDLSRETMSRLTFDPSEDFNPVWTADGERVAFGSQRRGISELYWKAADGTGTAERLTESEYFRWPAAVSPDGKSLVYLEAIPDATNILRLGVLSLNDNKTSTVLLDTEFTEASPQISPDGRWLAYQSNRTGQFEIYVRSFPNVDESLEQASSGGGTSPRWARGGDELFYLDPGGRLMRVPVRPGPELELGNPELVLEQPYYAPRAGGHPYDVSPDGERFLMIKPSEGSQDAPSPELILVQNWFEELKRLVPTQ